MYLKGSMQSFGYECRMSEEGEGGLVNIYAQLDSQEMPIPKDLSDYWQDPPSYFLIPGDVQTDMHALSAFGLCGSPAKDCLAFGAISLWSLPQKTICPTCLAAMCFD